MRDVFQKAEDKAGHQYLREVAGQHAGIVCSLRQLEAALCVSWA
jgi:hypothetical protein